MDALRKRPNPNRGMLRSMRCPGCGSYGPFKVIATVAITMTDTGIVEADGQAEWNSDSVCTCAQCKRTGVMGDFREPITDVTQ